MQCKTYDSSDLRTITWESAYYKYQFVADVVGDNPELFPIEDNRDLGDKLKKLGAIGEKVGLDTEACCFYISFRTKKEGVAFLKKLSAYLVQKARMLKQAQEY